MRTDIETRFIRPNPNHWHPDDFDLSDAVLTAQILHITKTVCLLESRCDDYAEYLRAIFINRGGRWDEAIDRWNVEECQHGVMLRGLSEAVDGSFAFQESMHMYESLVSYHEPTGESVRGSIGAELVSRCVVEALASALYRVVSDAIEHPTNREIYSRLAQDEARHFGMFLKMLNREAEQNGGLGMFNRLKFALLRMIQLEDSQITVASCVVAGRANDRIRLRREANHYLGQLYSCYRWKHLQYAVKMLLKTIGIRPTLLILKPTTFVPWSGVKARYLWARFCGSLFPPEKISFLNILRRFVELLSNFAASFARFCQPSRGTTTSR